MAAQPAVANLVAIASARLAFAAGDVAGARRLLAPHAGDDAMLLTAALWAELEAQSGQRAEAVERYSAIASGRGRAFLAWGLGSALQVENVIQMRRAQLRIAELALEDGQAARAQEALRALRRAWPGESMPRELRERVQAVERGISAAPVSAALP